MADSNRDVKLRVGVETAGSEELRGLAGDLTRVGAAGGAAAPEVQKLARELADAKDSTEEFRKAEAAARTDLAAQKRALDEKRDALARLKAATGAAIADESAHAKAVTAARLAILDQRAAIREQQAAVEASVASTKKATAAEQAIASDLKRAAAAYRETGDAAGNAADKQGRANKTVSEGLRDIHSQLASIRNIAGAAIGGQLLGGMVGDVAKTADAYQNLASRIRLVTGEGKAFDTAFEGVFDVAKRTNSAVDETGTLFVRIAQAGKAIGVSTRDALSLTETINQAIQVSGASAESSQAAIIQLIQGLQSGVLRGEEFNSVMEQAPRLAQALADGLGVTTGELRKLAEAGKLTSQTVIGALQGQASAVQNEFAALPATVGRALQNLSTEWTRYVGEVDKANGISSAAAKALNALASNLDTVGTVLFSLGKATAAYQALKLAQTFLGISSAAKVATAEVTALTAAQNAANAASNGAAAGAGRFSAILGGIKAFGLVAVLTNLREIGTAIGEGVAKLAGYGKAEQELEIRMRADEQASRANAAAKAALAQQMQIAADKALGLTTESKALVAEFEQVRQKGGSVTDALAKVTKALELGDLTGIANAGAALDALAQKGQLSGQQVREALASALKGVDLGVFAAEASAAFDSSEQGARRLKAAIDAVAIEALHRAGTSALELKTGFSEATASALNDLDALQKGLKDLGATSDDTGRLLSVSLDKALSVASTERAVREVIARTEELGRTGQLSGEQFALGMDKARQKLDELKPGINSLEEALHSFGLKSREELQTTADKMRASWEQIRNSVTVSIADKQRAFEQFAAAAIAANGGVETSEITVARRMLEIQAAAAPTGTAIADAMHKGRQATEDLITSTNRLLEQQDRLARQQAQVNGTKTAGGINAPGDLGSVTGSTREDRLAGQNAVDNSLIFKLIDKLNAGTLTAADLPDVQNALAAAKQNKSMDEDVTRTAAGSFTTEHLRDVDGMIRAMQRALETLGGGSGQGLAGSTQTVEPTQQKTPTSSGGTRTIKIDLGGRTTSVNVASDADAQALESLLQQLAGAASRAGG